MTDKEIKSIIEKCRKTEDDPEKTEKVNYVMDFGEFTIQYDFSLN